MDRSRVLTLIKNTYRTDSLGQRIAQEEKREVFCSIGSVTASEWFEAGRNGMNAQHRVTMFAPDYQGETVCELEGVRYGIYRTYLRKGEEIELYLERKAGV